MKYSVSINEKKRTITVTLADGTKGVAKCNPSDRFDINTGIELALERAKVAQKNNNAKVNTASPTAQRMTATMLAKQLEKTLPTGSIIVAVGGGDNCLTEAGKKWLAKIAGVNEKRCSCDKQKFTAYDNGYNDGYADGCDDASREAIEAATDAYNEGYEDGFKDGSKDVEEAKSDAYYEGYEEGRDSIRVTLADALSELGLD